MTRTSDTNKYCSRANLTNEASVEQFFLTRLIEDLGYTDGQVRPKTSLSVIAVNLGRRQVNYKPDYAILYRGRPRWIADAKAPSEALDAWVGQCSSYCLNLNRGYSSDDPVRLFLLSNGETTRVYRWNVEEPLLEMAFADFVDGNPKFNQLTELLTPSAFSAASSASGEPTHTLLRPTVEQVNEAFAWCHQRIYKKDNLSQAAAFMEFVKVVFLKLLSDREVHRAHPELAERGEITLPASEIKFSTAWLAEREGDDPNPLDAIQFRQLLASMEEQIQTGEKKRIFPAGDQIRLTPEIIREVTGKLESLDLFGIDADLNGRLFETFLNATMRGKDLGQYFTPRSVVKLATRLAQLRTEPGAADVVLDACCGTGGFLIEALASMWDAVDANPVLSDSDKEDLRKQIANHHIYGMDIAKEPVLARIARINMYLHGDGGSSIYQTDSLDKAVRDIAGDSAELKRERRELRQLLSVGPLATVVLTNPPFAKTYDRSHASEARIIDDYELGFSTSGGSRRPVPSLRSSLMFLERYYDLLKPGGRMVTVIDDSVLGGDDYAEARDFIRRQFLVRAVISLPGDAFQRSKARVKTSLLILQKRREDTELQGPVFMGYCSIVGVDDPARQRVLASDAGVREAAKREIDAVAASYEAFTSGNPQAASWTVPADAILDRMDVKACLIKTARHRGDWEATDGTRLLSDVVRVVYDRESRVTGSTDDLIDTRENEDEVTPIRVQYNGMAVPEEAITASTSTYRWLYRVHTDDIVFSHINAVQGAVAVVPSELDGAVVTPEYTVCRAVEGVDPREVWALVRSPEARSDLLVLSTGIGRARIRWSNASQLVLPGLDAATTNALVGSISQAEEFEERARSLRSTAVEQLYAAKTLGDQEALDIIAAFKPPR